MATDILDGVGDGLQAELMTFTMQQGLNQPLHAVAIFVQSQQRALGLLAPAAHDRKGWLLHFTNHLKALSTQDHC
ncbi:MAG: hypothetical protein ACPG1C_04810 [Alphaproteobacteria bacterium]